MAAATGLAAARMGHAAWGMRIPAAKRLVIVEPLFAHRATDGLRLHLRSRCRGRRVPRGAGVSLPGAGRILAIDVSVSAAVKIVWRERLRRCGRGCHVRVRIGLFKSAWRCGRCGNVRVEIAVVGAVVLEAIVVEGVARIWVEVSAPRMRPLSAVPRVEAVTVFGARDARPPVLINVYVIEADVIVIEVVPPTPAICPPPRMTPRAQPFARAKPKAKSDPPVDGEPRVKSISARPAHPIAPD